MDRIPPSSSEPSPAATRPWPRRRRPAALVALLAALVLPACSSRLGAPRAATEEGERILSLWRVLFWSAVGVGLLVVVLIFWCLVRYRSRADGPEPDQRHGNVPLEIAYFVAPAVLAAVLFGLSVATEDATARVTRRPALAVDVTGFQWQWRFHYPDEGVTVLGTQEALPELVLPAGQRVRFRLRATDVIHSFYVPGFLTKRDLVPGGENLLEVTTTRPGVHLGNCAEFCGIDHARMGFTVRIVAPDEFARWVSSRRATGPPVTQPPPTSTTEVQP